MRQKMGANEDLTLRKLAAETSIKEMVVERAISQGAPLSIVLRVLGVIFGDVHCQLEPIASDAAPLVARETDMRKCQRILEAAIDAARVRIQADAKKLPELKLPELENQSAQRTQK